VQFAWSTLGRLDTPPVVTIDSPGVGGTLPVDEPGVISWDASDVDTVTGIQIAVSSDGGATWSTVANLSGNPGSYAYRAPCAQEGNSYAVRVRALDEHGWSDQGEAVRAFTPSRFCLAGEEPTVPLSFAFLPVTPNPSTGPTAFHFYLPEGAALAAAPRLRIYDVRGRLVREISLAAALSGPNGAAWDGLDRDGRAAHTGMYVARLEAGGRTASVRFVRLLAR
jgi:hypothetical protein